MPTQANLNYCARVRSRLARRPRTVQYKHIAKATGVPEHWLRAFATQRFEQPKLDYVQLVEQFLDNSEAR